MKLTLFIPLKPAYNEFFNGKKAVFPQKLMTKAKRFFL
jgi:hypothetical protein